MIEFNRYRTNIKNFNCPDGTYPVIKKGNIDSKGIWKGDVAYCKAIDLQEVYDFQRRVDDESVALFQKYGCKGLSHIIDETMELSRRNPQKYEKIKGLYSVAKEAQEDMCVDFRL